MYYLNPCHSSWFFSFFFYMIFFSVFPTKSNLLSKIMVDLFLCVCVKRSKHSYPTQVLRLTFIFYRYFFLKLVFTCSFDAFAISLVTYFCKTIKKEHKIRIFRSEIYEMLCRKRREIVRHYFLFAVFFLPNQIPIKTQCLVLCDLTHNNSKTSRK